MRDVNLSGMKIVFIVQVFIAWLFVNNSFSQEVTADFSFVQDCESFVFTNESEATGGLTISGYLWDFGDAIGTSTDINPVYSYLAEGDYEVFLTVFHDGAGGQETTSQMVSFWISEADFTAAAVCVGEISVFEGFSSSPNSPIVSWEWDMDDDGTYELSGNPVSFVFPDAGLQKVTLKATNELGCAIFKSKNVNIKDAPVADFTAGPVCFGNSTQFFDNSSTPVGNILFWRWDFNNDGIPDDFSENPVHTFPGGGVFTVGLEVENSLGCSASVSHDVVVFDLPEASFTIDPGCPLEATSFTDGSIEGDAVIVSWEWDFDDGSPVVNDPNPVHTFTSNGLFNVTLLVGDGNGCQDDTTQIVVQQKPEAEFQVEDVCLGSPASFMDMSTFEAGFEIVSWEWDFGDGLGNSTDQNPEYFYLSPGEYEVELVVSNALSCSDTVSATIEIYDLPVASFGYDVACEGLPVCFSDSSVANASSIISWNWILGDGSSNTLQNPCHIYLTSGSYEVTLTVENSNGCVSVPFTETLLVSVAPDVDFEYNQICFGDTTFFENLTDTFGYQISFLEWDFGDPESSTNSSTLFSPFHLYTSPGNYDVKLVVENEYGCKDSLISTITIDSLPVANFLMPDTISKGVQFTLNDLSLAQGSPIFTWYWDFGDGTSGTNINPLTHSFSQPGSYVVCLTVTDFNGCSDQFCDTIQVVNKPQANFSYASDVDLQTYFTDGSQPSFSIVNWFWNFGDPTTTLDTISGTSAPVWQYPAEGWYSVFLEVEDGFGGMHDTTKLIFAGNAVVPDFEQSGQCIGDTTFFIDKSYSPIASTFEVWYWDFGDGSDTTYTEQVDTIIHHYQFPGIYPVKFAVSATVNGFFMTDTLVKPVSIFESPVARIDTTGLNVCLGTAIQFNDKTPAILDPIVEWIWDFDTDNGDSAFIKNPAFLYADTGTYSVKMVVVTEQGCQSKDSVMAHVNVSPDFGFIIDNNCVNSPTYFIPDYDSTKITITKWHWNFGDELSSSNTSSLARPSHVYNRVAEFTITMKMEAFGCAGETKQSTLVYPIPFSQFSLKADFEGVQGRTKFTNNSIYATSYLWDFGNGNTSTVPDPVEVYEFDSTYTITLISYNEYFCSDTSRADLVVFFKGLYFPTAFSPNNPIEEISVFQPKGVNLKDYLVQVFDMRGNLLWESDKVDEAGTPVEGWDGYYKGRLMPQDSYIWKAAGKFKDGTVWQGQSFDEAAPQTNGIVTLIR